MSAPIVYIEVAMALGVPKLTTEEDPCIALTKTKHVRVFGYVLANIPMQADGDEVKYDGKI